MSEPIQFKLQEIQQLVAKLQHPVDDAREVQLIISENWIQLKDVQSEIILSQVRRTAQKYIHLEP